MIRVKFTENFNSGKYIGKTKTLNNHTAKDLIENGFAVEFINDKNINKIVNNDDDDDNIKKSYHKEYDLKKIKKAGRPKIKK